MNIDDIFFAAINGEKEKLVELLETDAVDINQYLKTTVGGENIYVVLLFSVISKMIETNIDYDILDTLIYYGADIDKPIIIENDAYTRKIPIINYTIMQWESLELTEYLLSRGADPNAIRTEDYGRTYKEIYQPLFFALRISSVNMVKLLLHYGADPNQCVSTYNQEVGCAQIMPLLFYATNNFMITTKKNANGNSSELTYWMLAYGADVNIIITPYINDTLRKERRDRYKFINYLNLEYKGCSWVITDGFRKLKGKRYLPSPVLKSNFVKPDKLNKITEERFSVANSFIKQSVSSSNEVLKSDSVEISTEKALNDVFSYFWKNQLDYKIYRSWGKMEPVSRIFLVVSLFFALCTVGWYFLAKTVEAIFLVPTLIPLVIYFILFIRRKNEANNYAKKAEKYHTGWIETINNFEKTVRISSDAEDRWWDLKDMGELDLTPDTLMVYGGAERTTETRDTVQLSSMFETGGVTSGAELEKMATNTEKFNVILRENISLEYEYNIAELCFWRVEDGTVLHSSLEDVYSETEIKSQVESYSAKLDSDEMLHNALYRKALYTDKEMFYLDKLDYWDYSLRDSIRSNKLYEYEEKLRAKKHLVYEAEDTNVYKQYFRPVGIIAFDTNNEVVAVLLYNDCKFTECYKTDYEKFIFEVTQKNISSDIIKDRFEVIKNLRYYRVKSLDAFSAKPDYLSNEEWQMLLFTSKAYGVEKKDIADVVRSNYGTASKNKQKSLNKANFGW